jgi:hypothetical protein
VLVLGRVASIDDAPLNSAGAVVFALLSYRRWRAADELGEPASANTAGR